jgi:predicted metal-dependent hydrolase
LAAGALLFQAGLFFEVHEVLELAWRRLAGPRRNDVQGLIQIAAGMHHLAHDRPGSAVTLFAKARIRLERSAGGLDGVDVEALLATLTPWETAARTGRWPARLALPSFGDAAATRRDRLLPARRPSA